MAISILPVIGIIVVVSTFQGLLLLLLCPFRDLSLQFIAALVYFWSSIRLATYEVSSKIVDV